VLKQCSLVRLCQESWVSALEIQLNVFQQELALPGDDMHVDMLYKARHDIYIYMERERERVIKNIYIYIYLHIYTCCTCLRIKVRNVLLRLLSELGVTIHAPDYLEISTQSRGFPQRIRRTLMYRFPQIKLYLTTAG